MVVQQKEGELVSAFSENMLDVTLLSPPILHSISSPVSTSLCWAACPLCSCLSGLAVTRLEASRLETRAATNILALCCSLVQGQHREILGAAVSLSELSTKLREVSQCAEHGVRESAQVSQLVMLCRQWAHLQCFAGRTSRTLGTTVAGKHAQYRKIRPFRKNLRSKILLPSP